jgi:spore germination protein
MFRSKWLLIVCVLSAGITGCNDQRILEQLGYTHTVSYDLESKKDDEILELKIGIFIPIADPDSKEDREILITKAKSSKIARTELSGRTSRILVSGQLRNSLFGENLARLGIWDHIDTLVRDPSISQRVKVVLVEGSALELMKKDYPEHPRTGKYISDLLDKEANTQAIPDIMIYQFARDYFDDGIDPVAPILKEEDEYLTISGLGLFQDDRYMTKIDPDKGVLFATLTKNFKQGHIGIPLQSSNDEDVEIVALSAVLSNRKFRVQSKNDNFKVNIDIKIRGSILEYIGDKKLGDESERRKLEKDIAEYIQKETMIMIEKMQEYNVDSIGIGKYVRNSVGKEQWSNMNWREIYPNIDITTEVKVKIKDYGKFK